MTANHPIRRWFLGLTLLIVTLPAASHAQTPLLLDDLLAELQLTLIRVRDTLEDEELPNFTSARLNIKSTFQTTANGDLFLVVAEVHSDFEEASIVEVELELGPPDDADTYNISSTSDRLTDAIIQAVKTISAAQRGTPPLHPRKLTAAISFNASATVGGGPKVQFEVLGLELGGSAGGTSRTQSVQRIEIIFDYEA